MKVVRYADRDGGVHIATTDGDLGASLSSAHVTGASLSSAHVTGASLSSAHVTGASLSSAHVTVRRLPVTSLAELLAGDLDRFHALVDAGGPPVDDVERLLAPIDDRTELWAAGVTYLSSRDARIDESGDGDPYERVYRAGRPELFFKSVSWRVRGPGEPVAIRADSTLDAPEPELAVAVTASGEIAGYTICNDMTSRSIEAENPLYLSQAKIYAGSCALGPAIRLARSLPPDPTFAIAMEAGPADRPGGGRSHTDQMVRTPAQLVQWLYAELDFPAGVILTTGTGVVPAPGFTLQAGDSISIRIAEIGQLDNPVVRGKAAAGPVPSAHGAADR